MQPQPEVYLPAAACASRSLRLVAVVLSPCQFWGLDSVHTVGLDWIALWSDRAAKLQLGQASYVPEEGVELWSVAPLL